MRIINGDIYKIHYNEVEKVIYFEGSLRLWDPSEYQKIRQFMLDSLELNTDSLTLDFMKLEFLNSSGISTLCKFILDAKRINRQRIRVIGNNEILWQRKSFENLSKLWDEIKLEFR
jgi:hypothetical protein